MRSILAPLIVLAGSLAISSVSAAQTSLVPQGMLADRAALSPSDYIEIQQLYARYAAALDLGDGAVRATTFTSDGTFRNIASHHQPESVASVAQRTTAHGNIGDRHMISHLIITPTKTGANGFAYILKVDRLQKVYTGFYNDTLVRTPDGWRFKTKEEWHDTEPGSPYRPRDEGKGPQ
jgi:hypothetical protein